MELISRQAAIDKFEQWLKVKGYSDGELSMLKAVLYELRFLPSVQPEIIRCRDCVKLQTDVLADQCWCDGRKVTPDHYCGYAEGRADEPNN